MTLTLIPNLNKKSTSIKALPSSYSVDEVHAIEPKGANNFLYELPPTQTIFR